MNEIKEVNIKDIVVKDELYPRLKISEEIIENYAETLSLLPPITISQDNILIDGYHRLMAHKKAGKDKIECYIEVQKDHKEILMRAIELNARHGLQLSYKEKRKWAIDLFDGANKKRLREALGVTMDTLNKWIRHKSEIMKAETEEKMLDDYLVGGMSQKEIADKFDVSNSRINDIRNKHLKKINLFKSGGDIPEEVKKNYQEINAFIKAIEEGKFNSNTWFVSPEDNGHNIYANLVYQFTDPFDIISDCTKESNGICKDICRGFYRRYFPTAKTPTPPSLVILDDSHDGKILQDINGKMKNGHVAVVVNDTSKIPSIFAYMNKEKFNFADIVAMIQPEPINEGKKLLTGYKPLLLFSEGEIPKIKNETTRSLNEMLRKKEKEKDR